MRCALQGRETRDSDRNDGTTDNSAGRDTEKGELLCAALPESVNRQAAHGWSEQLASSECSLACHAPKHSASAVRAAMRRVLAGMGH